VSSLSWSLIFIGLLVAAALVARWILDTPREDPLIGLAYRCVQVYARLFHRLELSGLEHIPRERYPGALIVVCNHTAGVDPLLVQSACPFEIRWMMATDMMLTRYTWFWEWAGIISVDRTGKDAAGTKEAIRHVRSGGVLGVFPEGAIEKPARHVLPFHPGVGLIVARTGAPVMPVIIEGTPTPDGGGAWTSLWKRGRARVTFGPVIQYEKQSAGELADKLHDWFVEATGWPTAPTPMGPAFRG
jgi:1-acyl-sn-glycerol-3-phosphate acyltransferase